MDAAPDPRIAWTIAEMKRAIAQPLRVADFARAVNLAPSRFSVLFRSHTGCSPARYLRTLRLDEARRLLEHTFLSVKEVMALVGYNDPSHFTRDFSRFHGTAPSRVRGTQVLFETVDSPPT